MTLKNISCNGDVLVSSFLINDTVMLLMRDCLGLNSIKMYFSTVVRDTPLPHVKFLNRSNTDATSETKVL